MRVLLDHCVPRPFGGALIGHDVRTTYRMGWADLHNGYLLRAAGDVFDVIVTVDRSMQYQQNTGDLPLPLVLVLARSNKLEDLLPLAPRVVSLLNTRLERRAYVVGG